MTINTNVDYNSVPPVQYGNATILRPNKPTGSVRVEGTVEIFKPVTIHRPVVNLEASLIGAGRVLICSSDSHDLGSITARGIDTPKYSRPIVIVKDSK